MEIMKNFAINFLLAVLVTIGASSAAFLTAVILTSILIYLPAWVFIILTVLGLLVFLTFVIGEFLDES